MWKSQLGPFMIGVPKRNVIEKGQQRTTLEFCLSYIIIIGVDCCMPIDKRCLFKLIKIF
jgi:hypothetical protein